MYRLCEKTPGGKLFKVVQRSGLIKDERKGETDTFVFEDFTHPWAWISSTR